MRPNCLNCSEVLYPRDKYCGRCGQQTNIDRISFRELSHEFFHTILHVEKGVIRLFKGLLFKPGKTAAEFVEGKRKTYFNPFTFMAMCVALTIFAHNWLNPYIDPSVPDPAALASIPESERPAHLQKNERIADLQKFATKNMNLIDVVVCPWFAFGLWLFYRKRKRNIAEITIAYLLFTAFGLVLFTVFISIPMHFLRDSNAYYPIFWVGIILQSMYYTWGLKGFFNLHSAWDYIKILAVLALIAAIGIIPLSLFVAWYIG